jgi:hypothetical protein
MSSVNQRIELALTKVDNLIAAPAHGFWNVCDQEVFNICYSGISIVLEPIQRHVRNNLMDQFQ